MNPTTDLPRPFVDLLRQLEADPLGQASRVIVDFVWSIAEGEAFVLTRLETIPQAAHDLCLALLDFCMGEGLSEDERAAAAAAFAPFRELYAGDSATRH